MTSLQSARRDNADAGRARPAGLLRPRWPLAVVTTLGGAGAAAGLLLVCLAIGVIGWFLSDAGAHGAPSDALRVGALGWLMGHGSGIVVAGTSVTAVPLGVTLVAAWSIWRVGLRVGDAVSGHGPDADALADGERDWTVPIAAALFAVGYAVVAVVVASLAGTTATAPSVAGVVTWSVAMCVLVGGVAISVGSGRAALWATLAPPLLRDTMATAKVLLRCWLALCTAVLLIALVLHLDTAVNVLSQLHLSPGEKVLYIGLCLLILPNSVVFAWAYLLGPGFSVGVGTVVSPTAVSIGSLPMLPLFAALPGNGTHPVWTPYLVALAPLTAIVAVCWVQRRRPSLVWSEGLLRGGCAGVVAGVVIGFCSGLAGGSIGPGRMADVGPFAGSVLVHAIASFGIAGAVAGLAMTWWQRRVAARR
ncbi:MAG: DUF6350 family protein [Nocardioides sp.]|uniref:cell division protein PerM n=1 Tax=Nocardioides sp. TaxID=35761 RepID=UPI0039E69D5D